MGAAESTQANSDANTNTNNNNVSTNPNVTNPTAAVPANTSQVEVKTTDTTTIANKQTKEKAPEASTATVTAAPQHSSTVANEVHNASTPVSTSAAAPSTIPASHPQIQIPKPSIGSRTGPQVSPVPTLKSSPRLVATNAPLPTYSPPASTNRPTVVVGAPAGYSVPVLASPSVQPIDHAQKPIPHHELPASINTASSNSVPSNLDHPQQSVPSATTSDKSLPAVAAATATVITTPARNIEGKELKPISTSPSKTTKVQDTTGKASKLLAENPVWSIVINWMTPLLPQDRTLSIDESQLASIVSSASSTEDFLTILQQKRVERKQKRRERTAIENEAKAAGKPIPPRAVTEELKVDSPFHPLSVPIPWEIAEKLLLIDPNLSNLRLQWVPARVNEDQFFSEYFANVVRLVGQFVQQ